MKPLLLFIYYLTIAPITILAQNVLSDIVFDKRHHDFGTISEDGDNPTCEFTFTNRSSRPLAIAHVQTSCGCAVARYTREAVLPGKTGVISVTYNPHGRPGKFKKAVIVNLLTSTETVCLTITGMVTPGAERKDKRFPYVMGDLQLRTTGLRFTPMRGNLQEQSITVVNSGTLPLRVQLHSSDATLSGQLEPGVLAPDSVGEIHINRRADADKTQSKCIRLKEDTRQPRKAGYIYMEIGVEECR